MKGIFTKSVLMFALVTFGWQIQSFGQFSISGQLGWAVPQGDVAEFEGQEIASGGLNVDFDALYHLEAMDYKVGVGLTYNTSLLVAAGEDASGIYGLNIYGVKGVYLLSAESSITPYGGLSLGLGQLSTPETSINGQVVVESESAFSLGIRPEVGLSLGGFLMSVSYVVPTGYKFENAEESLSAGALQFSIGYRYMNW